MFRDNVACFNVRGAIIGYILKYLTAGAQRFATHNLGSAPQYRFNEAKKARQEASDTVTSLYKMLCRIDGADAAITATAI